MSDNYLLSISSYKTDKSEIEGEIIPTGLDTLYFTLYRFNEIITVFTVRCPMLGRNE
jgi:hypothetical protein